MRELDLRPPAPDDWPALLELANRSVADVPGAKGQEAWAQNRRAGAGVQRHWVAHDTATDEIIGYVSVERRSDDEPSARLFVVTDPALRSDVASQLLRHALDVARRDGATEVRFVEYASDEAFLAFLRGHGFDEMRRFALPDGAANPPVAPPTRVAQPPPAVPSSCNARSDGALAAASPRRRRRQPARTRHQPV